MSTEANFNTEEDDEQQLAGGAQPSGGAVASSNPMSAPMGAQRDQSPSGRPNIKQYLNANQGAGDRLGAGIQDKSQDLTNKFNTSLDQNRNELNTSSQPLEQKLGDQGKQFAQTAFKDPSALLAQQDQVSEFQKLQGGGYQQDIGGLQNQFNTQKSMLQQDAGKIQGQANLAGSENGRFELLRNTFGKPTYTAGQQKLDQLFLQAQPGANKALQASLGGMATQATEGLTGLDSEAQAKLGALQGMSTARADEINKMVRGGLDTGLEGDLSQRGLDDMTLSSQNRYLQGQESLAGLPALQTRLANNQLNKSDLSTLGLSSGTQLYDVNMNDFISKTGQNPTLANTADPAEVARYRALAQLSGDQTADPFGGSAEVGGFNPYSYDKAALDAKIASSKNYYENDYAKTRAQALYNERLANSAGVGGGYLGTYKNAIDAATNADQIQTAFNNLEASQRGVGASTDYWSQQNALRDYLTKELPKQRGRVLVENPDDIENPNGFNVI